MTDFVRRLDAAEAAADGNFTSNVLSSSVSPPLDQYAVAKTAHYEPMVKEAKSQVSRGKRNMKPTFAPCIFSHMGEMNKTVISVH